MGIPLGKRAREAVHQIRDVAEKTSAWLRLALCLSVAALCVSALALIKAIRTV